MGKAASTVKAMNKFRAKIINPTVNIAKWNFLHSFNESFDELKWEIKFFKWLL